jgi:hypothetical protein
MEYKIISPTNMYYDYRVFENLEELLNYLSVQGWTVICMIHDDILLGREL